MQELNTELLIYLNSLLENPIIEKISLLFADLPIFFLPIFLVSTWIYYTYKEKDIKKKKNLLFIFYSCVIAVIINILIKVFVDIDRPETVLEGVGKLIIEHIPNKSFPSDHSAVGIAFLISLFFAGYKKTGLFFTIPVILMVISRVILGVHWPLDILAGSIIGIFSSVISFKILKNNKIVDKLNTQLLKFASFLKL